MTAPAPTVNTRLQSSHEKRSKFEGLAYNLVLAIVLSTAIIVLFGIAYPPPMPNTHAADWGAAIVAKATQAVPIIMTLLGSLGLGTGITLTRGHFDARLEQPPTP